MNKEIFDEYEIATREAALGLPPIEVGDGAELAARVFGAVPTSNARLQERRARIARVENARNGTPPSARGEEVAAAIFGGGK